VFTRDNGGLNILGYVIAVGLTLSLFQHMMSGIRHLVLDTGAGYELKRNKMGALATMAASITLTIVFWLYMGIK
jgi:succinate dehydrogenase / fumarate reductase cytochrome b subunit